MPELDSRFVRDQLLSLHQRVTQREEHDVEQDRKIDRHDQLIEMLITVVKGNAEIQHGGMLSQMAEINRMVAEVKIAQEVGERERQAARATAEAEKAALVRSQRERYKWVAVGLALAAVPGVKEIVDIVQKAIP